MKRSTWGSVKYDRATRKGIIRYWANEDERGYMRHSVTVRGSRADVERRRAELMLEHGQDAPCPTVGRIWETWYLPERRRRVESGDTSPRTLKQRESAWRCHVAPRWADVPVDAVRPIDVQRWIDGMSLSTATEAVVVLRGICDYAARYELVESNPMNTRYVMPGKSTVRRRDAGIWDLAGLNAVLAACADRWFGPAVALQGAGGLRVAESLAVDAVDVERREAHGITCAVVHVRQQVTAAGALTSRLKTPQSDRWAVVPGTPASWLLAAADGRRGMLTSDGSGEPVTTSRFAPHFEQALHEAGVERHPPKALRASWQTHMRWSLGVEPWAVERLMGHSDGSVTARHYDKPTVDELVERCTLAYAARPVFG